MNQRACSSLAILVLVLLLAACGGATPTPAPTLAATATPAPPTATPQPLVVADKELLTAPTVRIACDTGQGGQINCSRTEQGARITLSTTAAGFARWALQLGPVATPLRGDETLTLRARRTGALTPNLYLVEQDGDRIPVSLVKYGLTDDWSVVHIPLREIKDEQGAQPDFATVGAVQVVFEWADQGGVLDLASLQFVTIWKEPIAMAASSDERKTRTVMASGPWLRARRLRGGPDLRIRRCRSVRRRSSGR